MMTQTERPLSDEEREQLTARLANARNESTRAPLKTGAANGVVCLALAIATFLASDAPRVVIAVFWMSLCLVFTLWIGLPCRSLMKARCACYATRVDANDCG